MKRLPFNVLLVVLVIMGSSAWTFRTTPDSTPPKIQHLKFGSITIDGTVHEKDVVIENGIVRQRKKGPSKPFRSEYGHTPVTELEEIPWDCDTL
jgi:hypothetical protein